MGVEKYIDEGIKEIDDDGEEQPAAERKIVEEPPSPAPTEPTKDKPLQT